MFLSEIKSGDVIRMKALGTFFSSDFPVKEKNGKLYLTEVNSDGTGEDELTQRWLDECSDAITVL